MQIFLSIILYVFLAVLIIVLLLLLVPVCVKIELDYDKFTARLKILLFTINIYPLKEKKPRQKAKKQKEDKPKKQATSSAKKLSLEKITTLISAASGAIKIILRGVFVTKIQVVYPVTGKDPADTAISYGKMQAYANGAVATLRNFIYLKFKKVNLIPDFNNEYKYMRYFACNVWASPVIMLVAGIYIVRKII